MTVSCPNHPEVVADLSECAACGRSFCPDCIITLNGRTTCAACKSQNLRDIRSGTPDVLRQSGRGARLVAVLIDGLITGSVGMTIFALIAGAEFTTIVRENAQHQPPHLNIGMFLLQELLVFFLLPALYEGLMLANYQATVGKKAMGIIVVNNDGARMTTKQAWGRVGARYLCTIVPMLGLVDILMIFSSTRLCLHDRMADTTVVKKTA